MAFGPMKQRKFGCPEPNPATNSAEEAIDLSRGGAATPRLPVRDCLYPPITRKKRFLSPTMVYDNGMR